MGNLGKRLFGSIAACMLLAGLSGCGGGSGEGTGSSTKTLTWNPPTTYSDSTPLDPTKELERYEIYVRESGSFSEADSPMAEVGAIAPGTGQLLTSFDLANLGPYLSPGVTYRISLRAVSIVGLKSGFSEATAFSF